MKLFGRHEYNILKEIKSDLDVDENLREIERHKSRLSSLKMGLDAIDSSGTIFKSDSKKDLDKNFQKNDFSGLYVEKDIEENNLERDEGSIIFIEEDEDENRKKIYWYRWN